MPPILSKQIASCCRYTILHRPSFPVYKALRSHLSKANISTQLNKNHLLRCFFGENKSLINGYQVQRQLDSILRRYYSSSQSNNPQQSSSHDDKDGEKKDKDKEEMKRKITVLFIFSLVIQGALMLHLFMNSQSQNNSNLISTPQNTQGSKTPQSTEISWTQFVNDYLIKGEVESVYLTKGSHQVFVRLHPGAVVNGRPTREALLTLRVDNPQTVEEKIRDIERQLGIPAEQTLKIVWKDFSLAATIVGVTFTLIVMYALFSMSRGLSNNLRTLNPFENMTKAKYTRGDMAAGSASTPKIKFNDIAGMTQAKIEVKEYVEYLKNPSRFQNLGAKIPKGALLLGPPGCGKTLLAKAVASESDVPFLVMAGSDFVEMIGGLGAARMRQLFKDARTLRPCIIYIDEIDALGRSRNGGEGGQSASASGGESEHTLNQLLVEMDGMTDNSGIIMLASTNRADVLDKALLRPGRFDRHISIDLPTLPERKELFEMYLKKINLTKPLGEFVDYLAHATPGMSGADIANVCNEAALKAARDAQKSVGEQDLAYALDRIVAGQAKMTNTLSASERKTIAYHECGHVIVSWLLKHTDALLKVSIIPRTAAALGFAQYMPSDKKLFSKEELFENMCVALGGRAAETVVFNRITSGAESDLDRVRQLAYGQIKSFGMSDSIGLLAFRDDQSEDFQNKPYSKYLQSIIDIEAQQMVADAYKTAERLIIENRDKLDTLCKILLEREELTYDDVKAAIGPPPHGEKKAREIFDSVDPEPKLQGPHIRPYIQKF